MSVLFHLAAQQAWERASSAGANTTASLIRQKVEDKERGMGDVEHFALLALLVGVAITVAVLSNRISERIRIPAPAIFLLAAAVASDVVPSLGRLSVTTVQRVASVALDVILFDGGMHSGWRRVRT